MFSSKRRVRSMISGSLLGALIAVAFHGGPVTTSSPSRVVSTVSRFEFRSMPSLVPVPKSIDLLGDSDDDEPMKNNSLRKRSIEENDASSAEVFGKYSVIRERLDYSYHGLYSHYRQRLQDDIIDAIVNQTNFQDMNGHHCMRPQVPWIVFTAGAMGAGKSHVIRTLGERGLFPLEGFMVVDPDQIRRKLPEFNYYMKYYPESAGILTRKEAGLIAEIAIESGLQRGFNILVDGSLSNATWYESYIPTLRQNYPSLQIAILHVSAPREVVLERAFNRAKATGRVVPKDLLETTMEVVPKSVARLAPLVDFCAEIENPGAGDITLVTEEMTWESFRSQWAQKCLFADTDPSENHSQ